MDRSAVLCPWQLPDVTGQVDLFVNFISFQEMEHDVIENYFRHVDRLGARWVLLRNSVAGKPVGGPGELGVRKPVKRGDYLDIFSGYELVGSDHRLFGHSRREDSRRRSWCWPADRSAVSNELTDRTSFLSFIFFVLVAN